jgi:DNA-binding Xre family transcriptional regulator
VIEDWEPKQKDVTLGYFKRVNNLWYKRCTGPGHSGIVYLPATEKYFAVRKNRGVGNKGQFLSRCRLCENWANIKGDPPPIGPGFCPAYQVRPFVVEAVNRVGLNEFASRVGMSYEGLSRIIEGKTLRVRTTNLRKIILELISIKRKNEVSISSASRTRAIKRLHRYQGSVCPECGTLQDNVTEGCSHCADRIRQRLRRAG